MKSICHFFKIILVVLTFFLKQSISPRQLGMHVDEVARQSIPEKTLEVVL